MCLPFDCCNRDDHGGSPAQQQPRTRAPSDQYVVPPAAARGEGMNGAIGAGQGRAVGVNMNGERPGVKKNGEPAMGIYNSDSEVPASAATQSPEQRDQRIMAPTAAVQAPERGDQIFAAPSLAAQAPQYTEHVAAGRRHHAVAASQPKEGATDVMRTAPVPQVARRGEDD